MGWAAGAGVMTAGAMAALLGAAGGRTPEPPPSSETYREAAARIVEEQSRSSKAYEVLQHLTDRIGPRLSGSAGAEAAVRWTAESLRGQGLDVRLEPMVAPRWVRGVEAGEITTPVRQMLVLTALGFSPPTPEGGLEAEVVEVTSLEHLEALGEAQVGGRIVFLNREMKVGRGPDGYGALSPLRSRGPAAAARLGAVGALVRSLGTLSARLPHTGVTDFGDGPQIPAAAVSAEDAALIHRLLASGERVRVRLRLGCRRLPPVPSANVVADLRGRERPDEVVLIGAHLDSWDLGTGAIDDGAGVAMVMESLRVLKSLGLVPRRTVRGVLFMSEEVGVDGGEAYARAHAGELDRHVAAIESDSGAARPTGFSATTGEGGLDVLAGIATLLPGLGPGAVRAGFGGADIAPLLRGRVPQIGLRPDVTHYFDWHHTSADTLDKVDPGELAQNVAAMAVAAYVLAEMPGTLPRPEAPPPPP